MRNQCPGASCREILALNATEQEQHKHNDEDKAQPSAGVITPSPAVWPGGKCADKKQNQDDQQNGKRNVPP